MLGKKSECRVCIVDTVYALFLYMLISSENEIKKTIYFCSDGINVRIRRQINANYTKTNTNVITRFFNLLYLKLLILLKKRKKVYLDYFCQDHLYISGIIIGNSTYTMLEDGLANYAKDNIMRYKASRINMMLFNYIQQPYGVNNRCKKAYLTKDVDFEELKGKVECVDLQKQWDCSSLQKKEYILKSFTISLDKLNLLKKKAIILFTQPIDNNNVISEKRKIEIYTKIVNLYDKNKVVLKPHPREKTNYKTFFPEVMICDNYFPFELINVMGFKFTTAVTIFTSAVFNFSYDINIDWIDTNNFPDLVDYLGYMDVEEFTSDLTNIRVIKNIDSIQ